MSDMTPVRLVEAMPMRAGFRPLMAGTTPARAPAAEARDEFAAGLAEGQRVAKELFAEERARLLALVAGAEALQPEPSEELAAMVAQTVQALVEAIVGRTPPDREWLLERVRRAVALIEEAERAGPLVVHPLDAELLADAPLGLVVETDSSLRRGTLRLASSSGWIEDGTSVYLERLKAELATA